MDDIACEMDKYLCMRCGMCVGICPENCLTLDNEGYPQRIASKCNDCGLCQKVCSGVNFDVGYFSQKLFGKQYSLGKKLGSFMNAYVGYSTDNNLRLNATSGGIITTILACLIEQKEIDGAIVTVPDNNHPEKFKPIIARTKEELIKSANSKYTVIPLNQIFRDLRSTNGKFALVGLPCHVQAYRKLSEIDQSLANKISLVIGLYCGRTIEHAATISLIDMMGIPLTEIKEIKYRGGEWPGEFQIFTKDGACRSCHKDIYMYLGHLYCPKRCLTCIDYSNEFSDISVADAWTTENGEWKYPGGQSIVLERTEIGQRALQIARNEGYINIQKISKEEAIRTHEGSSNLRKKGAIINITKLKKQGKKYSDYGISFPNVSRKDRYEELRRFSARFMGKFSLTRKAIEFFAFKLIIELREPQMERKNKIKKIFWHSVNIILSRWFRW